MNETINSEVAHHRNGVLEQPLFQGQLLPLLVTPAQQGLDLKQWIAANKSTVEANSIKYGGVLFRGFDINTIEKFNSLMQIFSEEGFTYMFRSSPRHSLADRVYESTTYPKERKINMHSEQSYSYSMIHKIVFCCIKTATEQGETPIANNRGILNNLSPSLRNKFEQKGILYRRNLSGNIGMPWQEVFQTTSKEEVIKNCKENNIEYSFQGDDYLSLKWKKAAVAVHPQSMEKTWFNHGFFFNKFSLYEEMGVDHTDDLPEEYLAYNTYFGDGSDISHDEYLEIKNSYEKEKVEFKWQVGDVLFLDNMLTSHGRNPFKGERQIVVSMI